MNLEDGPRALTSLQLSGLFVVSMIAARMERSNKDGKEEGEMTSSGGISQGDPMQISRWCTVEIKSGICTPIKRKYREVNAAGYKYK